jgi:hypothetical protein
MQLVMRFEASPAEFGSRKHISIKLLDADGTQLGTAEGDATVEGGPAGRRSILQHILTLRDVVFPRPGDYVFAILVDGRTEAEIPLELVQIKEQANA